MAEIGYTLSSEEHGPSALVEYAARAEDAGFSFAVISDHYHPWTRTQGESPFVWTTLGAIARETADLRVGTGVTCPTIRIHPAIVAQAAATTAATFEGRFFLGVGTGERLNEDVLGDRWPPHAVRLEMLEEAVDVLRSLWTGEEVSHHGEHYTVENARLFTLPDEPPDVAVAAGAPGTATTAGELGDALVGTSPSEDTVEAFLDAHDGDDPPRYAQIHVCWAETDDEARSTVHEHWPNSALPGELGQELSTPAHFEQATELVTENRAVEHVPHGPDPDDYLEAVAEFEEAGYDHVYLHQIGPDQAGFFGFFEEELEPQLE